MKILFMDIDGVVNSHRTCVAHGGYPFDFTPEDMGKFDQTALALIRGICAASHSRIVLSSSWRNTHHFQDVAEALVLPIIDSTPNLPTIRGEEIKAWLDAHPEVQTYAIVDDNSDMLPEQQAHFVHTNLEDGLTWKDAVKLAEILGINIYEASPSRLREASKKLDWGET